VRLKRDRFNTLVGKQAKPAVAEPEPVAAPPPPSFPAPVIEFPAVLTDRLSRVESMVKDMWNPLRPKDAPTPLPPVVLQPQVDEAAIHERLAAIEAMLSDMASAKPAAATWDFVITRDVSGRIATVRAVKKPETEAPEQS
jgi:hypothetical protein